MNYFRLADYTFQAKNETTSMDAVAFLPAHLGTVKARVKALAKKKLDWNIEILEQDDTREVWFEKDFHVIIPNEHWEVFCSIFDRELDNNSYLNLRNILNEALEDEMKDLRRELKVALAHLFDSPDFKKADRIVGAWQWRFPTISYDTRQKLSVAISHEDKKNDIQDVYGKLLEAYGEDRGNLEMLIGALGDKRPLNTFAVLKGYDNIYGTRIHSRYEGVELYFESLLDMNYQLSQSIFTTSKELIGIIEEESNEIKLVGSVIYPKGGVFTFRFLRLLMDVIEDLATEEEEEE